MRRLALALIVLLLPLMAGAQESRVPGPVITRGQGDKCVADTDYMRRFHMVELVHQRDRTVQDGVRTTRFSLNGCVACHAEKDDAGAFKSINAPGQFCASCHEFTAVTIDCFECHATKPESNKEALAPFPLFAGITPHRTPSPTLPRQGGGGRKREPSPLAGEGWEGGRPWTRK